MRMNEWIQQIYIFSREINTLEKKLLFYEKRKIFFTFSYYEAQMKSKGFSSRKKNDT